MIVNDQPTLSVRHLSSVEFFPFDDKICNEMYGKIVKDSEKINPADGWSTDHLFCRKYIVFSPKTYRGDSHRLIERLKTTFWCILMSKLKSIHLMRCMFLDNSIEFLIRHFV